MTHYAISSETLPGAAFDAGWMTSAPHMLCHFRLEIMVTRKPKYPFI